MYQCTPPTTEIVVFFCIALVVCLCAYASGGINGLIVLCGCVVIAAVMAAIYYFIRRYLLN